MAYYILSDVGINKGTYGGPKKYFDTCVRQKKKKVKQRNFQVEKKQNIHKHFSSKSRFDKLKYGPK